MTDRPSQKRARTSIDPSVLREVAEGGASDAGGIPVGLLGDFLTVLADAVVIGRPIPSAELGTYRRLGDQAARHGVALRALLDLYLSAAWRLWRHLPPVAEAAHNPEGVVIAGEVMLHAVDDVVAMLAEGYQLARRSLVRAQEAARREFIDDLLNGSPDVVGLLQRAAGFGLDLSGPHAVAVVRAEHALDDSAPLLSRMQRAIEGKKGDAHALVASKGGQVVVVFPAPDPLAVDEVANRLASTLRSRSAPTRRSIGAWQIVLGRPGVGADGVLASYRGAGEVLDLAARLGLQAPVIHARDLIVYRVLFQDRVALADLVTSTLQPLQSARGGAQPLLDTLGAYFDSGGNSAGTARAMHLSVRAVNYRLDRVHRLTGLDPADAQGRLSLQVAALGARLLDWPATPPS